MADDDLIFADTADDALRKKPPERDPKDRTRPVPAMGKKRTGRGPRRPPPPEVALRPHVLVSPVLPEPLLLSRSKKHLVGREEGVDVRIKTDKVSRHHAELFWDGKCFVVKDLGSTNGSELNGRPLRPNALTPLHDDDTLSFGGYEVKVNVLQPGEFPDEELGGQTRKMHRP
jgi:pSer/pThr/pTyr-binding forkhead associated (FHA) protein